MVSIVSLWLPILVSAALVFAVSSVIHMLLPYHRGDYSRLPDEDKILEDLQKYSIPPGEYSVPYAADSKERNAPAFAEKVKKGPVAFLAVAKNEMPGMGTTMLLWFIYTVVVGILTAYITSRAVDPGAQYLSVFRFAGATAFIAYTVALWQDSIWFRRKWSTTIKNTLDGLIYALLTAGVFGWLWPV